MLLILNVPSCIFVIIYDLFIYCMVHARLFNFGNNFTVALLTVMVINIKENKNVKDIIIGDPEFNISELMTCLIFT